MTWLETVIIIGLVAAAWLDWRTRTVPNPVWYVMLAAMVPSLVKEVGEGGWGWGIHAMIAMAWAVIMIALWRGNMFRAGDAKGLIAMGVASPLVGYYAPMEARFFLPFDALPVALLVGEAWRRLGNHRTVPFFVVLLPVTLITMTFGGLLWWPFIWLIQILT